MPIAGSWHTERVWREKLEPGICREAVGHPLGLAAFQTAAGWQLGPTQNR